MKIYLLGIIFLLALSVNAQSTETYIELLRSNLQLEQKALIANSMDLSESESKDFWPVYNEFKVKSIKIGDRRLELIKKYAANFENLTPNSANEIVGESFKIRENSLNLQKDYYKKFKKAVGAIKAGKFLQLINQINTLIDIQISAELPLFPNAKTNSKSN